MNRTRGGMVVAGLVAVASATLLCGGLAMAAIGLTTVPSDFGPKETMDRLEAEIKSVGMTVFARIDHAAGASSVGLTMQDEELAPDSPAASTMRGAERLMVLAAIRREGGNISRAARSLGIARTTLYRHIRRR